MLIRNGIIITIVTLLSSVLYAAPTIFKTTDENGNPIFTDAPAEDDHAETVELKPMSTVTLTPVSPTTSQEQPPEHQQPVETPGGAAVQESRKTFYSSLEILTPRHGDTIRDTTAFQVLASSSPAILPDHAARLLIDGKPLGPGQQSLQFFITDIDRGSHILEVQIVDRANLPIISREIEVFVHRSGERDSAPAANPARPTPATDSPVAAPPSESPVSAPPAESPRAAPPAESPRAAPPTESPRAAPPTESPRAAPPAESPRAG